MHFIILKNKDTVLQDSKISDGFTPHFANEHRRMSVAQSSDLTIARNKNRVLIRAQSSQRTLRLGGCYFYAMLHSVHGAALIPLAETAQRSRVLSRHENLEEELIFQG